jgi:hypothetical protein
MIVGGAIGAILIFLSIAGCLTFLMHLDIRVSWTSGLAIAVVNPIIWMIFYSLKLDRMDAFAILLIIPSIFILMSFVLFYYLGELLSRKTKEIEPEEILPKEELRESNRRRWVIANVLVILLIVGLLIVPMVNYTPPHNIAPASFEANKGADIDNFRWTIVAISGSATVWKSDVYVQLRNASGFVITNEPITAASGTHGFKYEPVSSEDYIRVGDVLRLSKDYAEGCTITLVTPGATWQYALLTV